jgi:F-type H+-transporting ATPase subunit c
MDYGLLIHYGTIGLSIACTSVGAGIGEGIAGFAALKAIDRQPHAYNEIVRLSLISTALIETTAVLGLFIAMMLLMGAPKEPAAYTFVAELGIGLALCMSGFTIGVVAGFPAREATLAVARQPFRAQKILGFTIITQALVQTPIIAGFVVALLIKSFAVAAHTLPEALRLIAAGLSVGLGGIGPSIGLALFAQKASRALGLSKEAYSRVLPFSLISQTLIETPLIFALIVSLMLFFVMPPLGEHNLLAGIGAIAAAITVGLGTLGTGISSGLVSGAVCEKLATDSNASTLPRTSMFAQALIETSTIYAVLISFGILFACRNL